MVLDNKYNSENLCLVKSSYVSDTVLEIHPFIQQICIDFQVPLKVLWIKSMSSQPHWAYILGGKQNINEVDQEDI